jgi:hypothetical protein
VVVIISIFFAGTLIRPKRSTESLKIQAWILTFFSAWLLATQIPYTDFTATRYAKVTAFLGSVQLPAATLQAALAASGLSDKYSKLHHGKSRAVTRTRSGVNFLFSRPSRYLPLDCTALYYYTHSHSLRGCSETR